MQNHSTPSEDNWWILSHLHGSGIAFQAKSSGPVIITTGYAGEITDTDWHHIALVKVASEYGIYKDGTQISYVNDTSTASYGGSLLIGAYIGSVTTNYFYGSMDEVRIQKSNIFGASPVVGLTDTITVPTSEYSSTVGRSFAVII